jgi:hypothetical protein
VPSSLIFAALAGAWLVVLVPMIAKRRQEVARTAESALTSRVLRRPQPRAALKHAQEAPVISARTAPQDPDQALPIEQRRRRPGRGGFDPEIAAQQARAKYAFRQRVVITLLVGALVTGVLGYALTGTWWWAQAGFDTALVVYLVYLRRQVRIEEEVRQRRAARLAGSSTRRPASEHASGGPATRDAVADSGADGDTAGEQSTHERAPREDNAEPARQAAQDSAGHPAAPAAAPPEAPHPTAVALDTDDEDPMFDELSSTFQPPYRRAAGE